MKGIDESYGEGDVDGKAELVAGKVDHLLVRLLFGRSQHLGRVAQIRGRRLEELEQIGKVVLLHFLVP